MLSPCSIPHDSPQLCSVMPLLMQRVLDCFLGTSGPGTSAAFREMRISCQEFLKPFCCLISDLHNFGQSTCVNIRIMSTCWWPGFCTKCFLMAEFIELLLQPALMSWARLSIPYSTSCEVSINSKCSYWQTMTYYFSILRGQHR